METIQDTQDIIQLTKLNSCKNIYSNNSLARLESIQSDCLIISNRLIALGNISEVKLYFLKAANVNLLFQEIFLGNKYKILKTFDKFNFVSMRSCLSQWDLQFIINCSNENILQRYISYMPDFGDVLKNRYSEVSNILVRALLKKDQKSINQYTPLLRKFKLANLRGYEKGDMMCVLGILDNDINLINEGIAFLVKATKRDYAELASFYKVSLWATAMAKLAIRFGFEPDISNSFISKEIIGWVDTPFEKDEDLLRYEHQLGEMNNPGWTFDPNSIKQKYYKLEDLEEMRNPSKVGLFKKWFS